MRKSHSELGRLYHDGDVIVRQGEAGDCMYVIQSGEVEVVRHSGDAAIPLCILSGGEFFGEMSLFEKETRSASVVARGDVRVMTIDKRTLLRRLKEDPILAFNLVQTMSERIRAMETYLDDVLEKPGEI